MPLTSFNYYAVGHFSISHFRLASHVLRPRVDATTQVLDPRQVVNGPGFGQQADGWVVVVQGARRPLHGFERNRRRNSECRQVHPRVRGSVPGFSDVEDQVGVVRAHCVQLYL